MFCSMFWLLSFFVSIDVEQAVGMSSMLQALRERSCVEDAREDAWKFRTKIWVDAEVGSEACQVRKEAKAQNGGWTETH